MISSQYPNFLVEKKTWGQSYFFLNACNSLFQENKKQYYVIFLGLHSLLRIWKNGSSASKPTHVSNLVSFHTVLQIFSSIGKGQFPIK